MPRKGGVFLPLSTNFMDDPKVLRAGEQAGWLYLAMSLFCKRIEVDGVIEQAQIARLGIPNWKRRLTALLKEELIIQLDPDRYAIAAWLEHNDSVDELAERRRKDALRKAAGGRRKPGQETGT